MNAPPTNRPTLDSMRRLPIGEVINLPSEHLALLQEEASSTLDMAKRVVDWIEGAIALRYEQQAVALRGQQVKDTGTVRFDDGCVPVVAELNKKVAWDRSRTADEFHADLSPRRRCHSVLLPPNGHGRQP